MRGKFKARSAAASTALAALLAAMPAAAYVGPGAGLTLMAALWGLIVAIAVALSYVLIWPLRRWRNRRQVAAREGVEPPADDMEIAVDGERPGDDTRSRR
jgi:membrane protein implicated in regulation of membrane protease activity